MNYYKSRDTIFDFRDKENFKTSITYINDKFYIYKNSITYINDGFYQFLRIVRQLQNKLLIKRREFMHVSPFNYIWF